MRSFTKPATSVEAQIELLKSRGVLFSDAERARHYLEHAGYYRLSGYVLPFQNGGAGEDRHNCVNPVDFNEILDRYVFDRKLRILLIDAIERIEVSVRCNLTNEIGNADRPDGTAYGPHWYCDDSLFSEPDEHPDLLKEIRRQIGHNGATPQQLGRRDVFIQHYYDTYDDPSMPPSWMVFEAVSLGLISKLFDGLYKSKTTGICLPLKVNHETMSSWLHALSYVRNICAHHQRLWNRVLTIKPAIAKKHKTKFHGNDRLYAILVIVQLMLERIAPDNSWAENLQDLLRHNPAIPLSAMGIPENWSSEPFWKLTP